MTPNTNDSPEAIRNRNIAAVSPPMNWLNRKEGLIGRWARRSVRVAWRRASLDVEIDGLLHDRERRIRVLDHLAPELAGQRLVGLLVDGPLADRRAEAEAQQRLYRLGSSAAPIIGLPSDIFPVTAINPPTTPL